MIILSDKIKYDKMNSEITRAKSEMAQRAETAARRFTQRQNNRNNILNELSSDPFPMDEHITRSADTVFQVLFDTTSGRMAEFTGFEVFEIHELFGIVEQAFAIRETGRGRKSVFSPIERFVILLTYLRTADSFASLGTIFGMKGNSIQALISRTVEIVHDPLIKHFLAPITKADQLKMGNNFIYLRDYMSNS